MVATHYRWDFIGLSTDTKPTPETSEKVVDGSTFYCSDNSKLYVWCKNQWYEKEVSGGGGTTYTAGDGIVIDDGEIAIDLVQTTGNSTKKVMSQDAVTQALAGAGGGATQLTSADFNYPAENPDGIAIWLLEPGAYLWTANLKTYTSSAPTYTSYYKGTFLEIFEKAGNAFWFNAGDGFYYSMYMGGNGSQYVRNVIIDAQKVKQTTGTSTTDVMSQNATTSMVFADPATMNKIKIGANTFSSVGDDGIEIGKESKAKGTTTVAIGSGATVDSFADYGLAIGASTMTYGIDAIAIGYSAGTNSAKAVALGRGTHANHTFSVALGAGATTSVAGEVNVGTGSTYTTSGYNSSNYRIIRGVYDGQDAHDAATVAQGNTLATSAPTTSTVGVLGQLYTDTTNMHTYQCTAISGDTYTWTQRW